MTTYYYVTNSMSSGNPLVDFAFGGDRPRGTLTEARTMLREARKAGYVSLTPAAAEYSACAACQSGHYDDDDGSGTVQHDLGNGARMHTITPEQLRDAIQRELNA